MRRLERVTQTPKYRTLATL